MLYLVGNKRPFASKSDKLKFNTLQSIMLFVYALITVALVLVWINNLVEKTETKQS